MELLLNLVWFALSSSALLAWVWYRRSSSRREVPDMLRGLTVVVCILALLFPVISISDDLSQTLSLAEGTRIQDVLKSPEMRGIYHLAAIIPALLLTSQPELRIVARTLADESSVCLQHLFWPPLLEKRPPPAFA